MLTNFPQSRQAAQPLGEFRAASSLKHEAALINRDLSLIEFYRRVLDEALDRSQPILERVKFAAIFASNLDEFFMIRVSGLKEKLDNRYDVSPDAIPVSELLSEIRIQVSEMCRQHMDCLKNDLLPELARNGIVLCKYNELTDDERHTADRYFKDHVYPTLTPQAVDPTHPFPYISGGGINLAFFLNPKFHRRTSRVIGQDKPLFVRLKVPSFIPRFVALPNSDRFVLIEDVVAANIKYFAPDLAPEDCHLFRLTRDADLELREAETGDLLRAMEENLRRRRFGDVVRLEVRAGMPAEMVDYLKRSLEIEDDDIYHVDGPLNVKDAFQISELNRPDLCSPPLRTWTPPQFRTGESTFDIIRRGDLILHHPYNPYTIVTDLVREAAEDPDVLAIKMCLYRIGPHSPIAPLLIKASENGKQVTALIEIKARFDEANNIEWGRRLERAGVHVVYGLLGLKTHAKTTLIVRKEGSRLRRYVHLATGNYNPETSTIYTDLSLLTVDDKVGEDATELFNFLTVYSQRHDFNRLVVAPLNLRERMAELIERETENARNGRPARIIAKLNRLADADIVNRLYTASQAGVEIDLIVRGICTLRPGVPGMSENIRVRSIVGRLLEHSRVYYFENGGDSEIFMGSSDWMPRNLDRRVEVLTPIRDAGLKRFLKEEYLQAYLQDNVKARLMQPDGSFIRVEVGDKPFSAQQSFQDSANVYSFNQ